MSSTAQSRTRSTYTAPGTYTVSLTITNDAGALCGESATSQSAAASRSARVASITIPSSVNLTAGAAQQFTAVADAEGTEVPDISFA